MAKQGFFSEHWTDAAGKPAGGVATGRGFTISWQNGPLGRGDDRREPNGAFVEDVIEAVMDRIAYYQRTGFWSAFNADAESHLKAALVSLRSRTDDREARGVEGTHDK